MFLHCSETFPHLFWHSSTLPPCKWEKGMWIISPWNSGTWASQKQVSTSRPKSRGLCVPSVTYPLCSAGGPGTVQWDGLLQLKRLFQQGLVTRTIRTSSSLLHAGGAATRCIYPNRFYTLACRCRKFSLEVTSFKDCFKPPTLEAASRWGQTLGSSPISNTVLRPADEPRPASLLPHLPVCIPQALATTCSKVTEAWDGTNVESHTEIVHLLLLLKQVEKPYTWRQIQRWQLLSTAWEGCNCLNEAIK